MLHPDPDKRPSSADALYIAEKFKPKPDASDLMQQLEELKEENARLRSSLSGK